MPVLVRGNTDSDVILLVVHGGAGGTAEAHIEDFNSFVEEEYAVAYWDQRHAGSAQGSFDKEDLTIDQMAEDMAYVIRLLKHRYGADKKVFAWGHSWGVILGTWFLITQDQNLLEGFLASNGSHSATVEYQARIDYVKTFTQEMIDQGSSFSSFEVEGQTFTSLEQVINWAEANDPIESYSQLAILNRLVEVVKDYVLITYVQDSDNPDLISAPERLFQSPYNPLATFANLLRTGQLINNFNDQTSIQEFYDFSPLMDRITLPVALLWGGYDNIIGVPVAEDYYQQIATPEDDKRLIIYERSEHNPQFIENVKFSQDVIDFIEQYR